MAKGAISETIEFAGCEATVKLFKVRMDQYWHKLDYTATVHETGRAPIAYHTSLEKRPPVRD